MDANQNPNPYDFIINEPPKSKRFSLSGKSQKQRLMQVVIGVGILLIIFGGLLLLLQGGKNKDLDALYRLSASQQDLTELISSSSINLTSKALIDQAATTAVVVASQSQDVNAYLSKRGVKTTSKQITLYRNTEFKKALTEAKANGKFEESYQAIFANHLDGYKSLLRSAYNASKSKTLKSQLEAFYTQLFVIDNRQNTS